MATDGVDQWNHPENSIIGGFIRGPQKDDKKRKSLVSVNQPSASSLSYKDELEAEARWVARESQKAVLGHPGASKRMFPKGPSPTRNRRTKLAVMGVSSDLLRQGDPEYERCVRLASAYRKVRARELAVSHGFVSSGASALLATAALALAGSRFLFEYAASLPKPEIGPTLKMASNLADSARQNELAAWELCAREAVAKKKLAASNAGIPWVVSADEPESQRPGPKPKQKQPLILPPVGTALDGWVQEATIDPEQEVD